MAPVGAPHLAIATARISVVSNPITRAKKREKLLTPEPAWRVLVSTRTDVDVGNVMDAIPLELSLLLLLARALPVAL